MEENQRIGIDELWQSRDLIAWQGALDWYWTLTLPKNEALERSLDTLDRERIRRFDEREWYNFLHDEYFRWKYTAPNRYATTTRHLRGYEQEGKLNDLFRLKERLLSMDPGDIRGGLQIAEEIRGLGTAGASGLLSLMYPKEFATVDQFVVKALRDVSGLKEAAAVKKMNPESLSTRDGVLLIEILQRKANENNQLWKTDTWTSRKIDKILWTYGRD